MRIQHNIPALNAHRNLTNNNSAVSKNLEKLSSGYRINRAGDDAAGLAISEKMRAQITGLQTAQKNAEDGVSLVQTAEGALTEVHSMLNRMVELATQSANGTYSESNRKEMQKEIDALNAEIDRISETSNFNGTKLFQGGVKAPTDSTVTFTDGNNGTAEAKVTFDVDGVAFEQDGDVTVTLGGNDYTVAVTAGMTADDFANALVTEINKNKITDGTAGEFTAVAAGTEITLTSANQGVVADADLKTALQKPLSIKAAGAGMEAVIKLHVGESPETANTIEIKIKEMSAESLKVSDLNITTIDGAKTAIGTINKAIDDVSGIRSDLGALQNRLEHTINNLGVQTENITAAESRIRDVDMAKEMMAYTKNNILVQASQAMLAQANQVPQGVLQLLQ